MTLTETETDPRSSSRTNRWVVTRDQFAAAEQRYATPADSGLVAQSAQIFYESDPTTLRELLPPPLEATTPTVWVSFGYLAQIDLGVAQVAVACSYRGEEGWYCLHLPMSTEAAVVGGRERYGENKKIADIKFQRDDTHVTASVTRYGITYLELDATVTGSLTPPEQEIVPHFYFKYSLAADGSGFDHDPVLIRSVHTRRPRKMDALDATLTLRESNTDPVADLPILNVTNAFYSDRSNFIKASAVEKIDPDSFIPYVYQRYDMAGQG